MAFHIADVPRPMYAYVDSRYLYDFAADVIPEWRSCMIYGLSALPGRAWGLSVLLDDGAIYQHLPVHAFSLRSDYTADWEQHYHDLTELQVWSCYGNTFATHEYGALSEMSARVYLGNGKWEMGRYWFTAAPWDDCFSTTPDQHKHFNFMWLECGALASLPGNRLLFNDPSFTTNMPAWGSRPAYQVNTRYWFPEDREGIFDGTITEVSG
jgi:hypothetical protein